MTAAPRCRLYLITPPQLDVAAFARALDTALGTGDVACVQLRLKDADDAAIRAATEALLPITQAHDAAFILNDRPDLAAAMGCDGVHVGQEDWSYTAARRAVGDNAIVGVTCHDSRHLAIEAAEQGADYVAFGAFYPTLTKSPKAHAAPDLLDWWSELMEVPCVAIGGITADNCPPLVTAGADFVAVSSAVWDHPEGPAAAVRGFNRVLDAMAPDSP